MANKFFAAIRARFFNTAADTALDVGVSGDANPRLSIDAGGKISWGDGTNAVDTNIYRDSASVLKTDDTLKVPVLFIDGIEVDTTGATTDQVLKYNGTKFLPATGSSVGALNDLSDVVITTPLEFQTLEYNGTNWVNANSPSSVYVRNAEATTITTGTCVYLFGATGDHATVKRADNNSDTTSSKTVGVVSANILASENGVVVTQGYVDGIDLSVGYTAGDVLWLGEAGAFTKTKPTAPDHLVFIGVVVRATNNGIIYVATQNGYELDELHNVSLPSPASGEFLKYNGSLWVADAIDLGTDTTGNYMSGISGTSPVSVSHTPSEGSSATVSLSSGYGDTQNPYGSKTANYVLASPDGSSGAPSFRALTATDIPYPGSANQIIYKNSSNVATGSSGLQYDGTSIKVNGNLESVYSNGDEGGEIFLSKASTNTTIVTGVTIDVNQNRLRFYENGGTNRGFYIDITGGAAAATTNLVGGGGATTLDGLTDVTAPSPSSGDFLKWNGTAWVNDAIDLGTDTTGNYMSGISGTSPVSVAHTAGEGSSATVSLAASYGDTQNPYASKTANYVLAAPNGSAGVPTFRAIVAADIPTLNQNTTGTAATVTGAAQTAITSVGTLTGLTVSNATTAATFSGSTTNSANPVVTLNGVSGSGSLNLFNDMGAGSYNGIVTAGSKGIIASGANSTTSRGSFVIAPWSDTAYGIRLSGGSTTDILVRGTTTFTPSIAANKALIVQGVASQAGDFFDVQESGGASRFKVDSSGNLFVASNITTGDAKTKVGFGRTGNGYSYIDLIGDATYTDYGLRLLRGNTGANAASELLHRGTGALSIITQEVAPMIFSTSNTERMRINSAGNVGIGTASPATALQVVGTVTATAFAGPLTGNVTGNVSGSAATVTGAAQTAITSVGTLTALTVSGNLTVDTSTLFVDATNNRVGIGTASPNSALHVFAGALGGTAGDELIATQVRATNNNQDIVYTKYRRVSTGADWTTAQAKIQRTIDATDMGYVAFGGTSAQDVRIGSGTTDIATFASNGTIVTTSTAAAKVLVVKGAASQSGDFIDVQDSGGASQFKVDSTGNLLVGATSRRSVGGSFQTAVVNQIFNEQGSGGLTAFTSVLNRADSNGLRFVLGKSRGTTAGAVTALVDGDSIANLMFAGADGTTLDPIAAQITANVDGTVATGSVPGRITFFTTSNGASVNAERMRITNAGNVGIATTVPVARLEVLGSNTVSSQTNVSGAFGTTTSGRLLLGSITGNTPFIGSEGATTLAFTTNATVRMRIDSSGNVGIGTASPTEKLDVAGNIALTGSVVFEGATADGFETTLAVTEPTGSDKTITLPNASGTVALIAVSDTAPTAPVAGNLWYKSDTGAMYVYYDSFWIEVGSPSSGLDGGSA
jgi:hypothetical protein